MNRSFRFAAHPFVGYYVLISLLYGMIALPLDLIGALR